MNDYLKLKEFWNEALIGDASYMKDKFVTSEVINNIFNKYITNSSCVLDYGCGSGWALFEIYNTVMFKEGTGIDTSSNAISALQKVVKDNNLSNISFFEGDHNTLTNSKKQYDFIISVNVLDVVPDEILKEILNSLLVSLKENAHLLICLNHEFSKEELSNLLQMTCMGNYYYKNDILRCNYKSHEEWKELFSTYANVVEDGTFVLFDGEKYARQYFLLKK